MALKIGHTTKTFTIDGNRFEMRRTRDGVMEMWGKDDLALATALGFAHGLDRMLHLMLVRLFGQGRLTECLENNEENLEWDRCRGRCCKPLERGTPTGGKLLQRPQLFWQKVRLSVGIHVDTVSP